MVTASEVEQARDLLKLLIDRYSATMFNEEAVWELVDSPAFQDALKHTLDAWDFDNLETKAAVLQNMRDLRLKLIHSPATEGALKADWAIIIIDAIIDQIKERGATDETHELTRVRAAQDR